MAIIICREREVMGRNDHINGQVNKFVIFAKKFFKGTAIIMIAGMLACIIKDDWGFMHMATALNLFYFAFIILESMSDKSKKRYCRN